MSRGARILAWIPAISLCLVTASASGPGEPGPRATLVVLEGTVASVDEVKAESGLVVVRARIETEEGSRSVLLAPRAVLDEIDLPVAPGDRIRARVFSAPAGEDLAAHKVFNLTRERMARLRTLNHDPLWDNQGVWQGGRSGGRGRGGPPPGAGKGPQGKGGG